MSYQTVGQGLATRIQQWILLLAGGDDGSVGFLVARINEADERLPRL